MEKQDLSFKLKLTLIISSILFVCAVGTTYAYLSYFDSNSNTITGNMASIGLKLDVDQILPKNDEHNTGVLVPQLTQYLESALKGKCIDENNNLVCKVYKIIVKNDGGTANELFDGNLLFYANDSFTKDISEIMPNLKWKLVNSVNEQNFNNSILGTSSVKIANAEKTNENNYFFKNVFLEPNQEVTYYIVIWIEEQDDIQIDNSTIDEVKNFYGLINVDLSNGGMLTATFS